MRSGSSRQEQSSFYDEYADNPKLIGVYRTDADARAAIQRVGGQIGFRDKPSGFQIEKYELNKDHWTEGFITEP